MLDVTPEKLWFGMSGMFLLGVFIGGVICYRWGYLDGKDAVAPDRRGRRR